MSQSEDTGERLTVDVARLGHRGDGIAEADTGPVFVPGALPGETVEGVVADGRMAAPRIVQAADQRVKPPCRHAGACGGCQLQHASDAFVADWKVDVVRRALDAQGLAAAVLPPVVSPAQSRRRAAFAARRTKKGALAGFHGKASDVVHAVPGCLLVRPALLDALPLAEALARAGASRKHGLTVQATDSEGGLDVSVTGGVPPGPADFAALAETHDVARLAWADTVLVRRPPVQRFDGIAVEPPPGAFLQATGEGEATLQAAVLRAVARADAVADLFAGCGTFALPLARQASVHAVEADAAMLAALDRGWRHAPGLRAVTTEARDLFRNPLLPDELQRFDAVVIDPPRSGAAAQVAQIAAARVPVVAHVSCNPVTFARDCAALVAAGYAIGPVQVVDQFRWSTHLELVATLRFEG